MEPLVHSGMGATVCEFRLWQGARRDVYQLIHERRATPPQAKFARSRRVTRGQRRADVARLVHSRLLNFGSRLGAPLRAHNAPHAGVNQRFL